MPKYKVKFVHTEEITYEGWVEAETEEMAYNMVDEEPFDVNDLEDVEHQGIEITNIAVEEV